VKDYANNTNLSEVKSAVEEKTGVNIDDTKNVVEQYTGKLPI
jgi:3-dehydroquinate synthetase